MIQLETRLLEILDWDESRAEQLYAAAAAFVSNSRFYDIGTLRRETVKYLSSLEPEEACSIVFQILDYNIRSEMRVIEE
jgi:hypothetical protein